jgi:hypothetical protein
MASIDSAVVARDAFLGFDLHALQQALVRGVRPRKQPFTLARVHFGKGGGDRGDALLARHGARLLLEGDRAALVHAPVDLRSPPKTPSTREPLPQSLVQAPWDPSQKR